MPLMFLNVITGETVQALADAKSMADGQAVMRRALTAFDLKHFSYLSISAAPRQPPVVSTTYSADWQRRYFEQGYVQIDPVVSASSGAVLPFDWETIDRSEGRTRIFFGESREHDVGSQGITFPFRGACGELALVSANTDVDPRLWNSLCGLLLTDFIVVASYFHAWASSRAETASRADSQRLTARERECLSWCAAGKSIWDVSAILGVSERTVRFHLTNARRKLRAASTIHAVAKAIRHAAITLP